mmetsp:Transcript_30233/g.42163  ORF Transcript_30233/g.42163 Transcript_30233/m.42163 type:complete len:217 (-) Transcript_30233:500-1150(-)
MLRAPTTSSSLCSLTLGTRRPPLPTTFLQPSPNTGCTTSSRCWTILKLTSTTNAWLCAMATFLTTLHLTPTQLPTKTRTTCFPPRLPTRKSTPTLLFTMLFTTSSTQPPRPSSGASECTTTLRCTRLTTASQTTTTPPTQRRLTWTLATDRTLTTLRVTAKKATSTTQLACTTFIRRLRRMTQSPRPSPTLSLAKLLNLDNMPLTLLRFTPRAHML